MVIHHHITIILSPILPRSLQLGLPEDREIGSCRVVAPLSLGRVGEISFRVNG